MGMTYPKLRKLYLRYQHKPGFSLTTKCMTNNKQSSAILFLQTILLLTLLFPSLLLAENKSLPFDDSQSLLPLLLPENIKYAATTEQTSVAMQDKSEELLPPFTINVHDSYPSLEERELGIPVIDEQTKDKRLWDRALPFLAQKVIDLGFDLPNPYGLAVIPGWIEQDLVLESLAVSINSGPQQGIGFVDFGTPFVENKTVQFKVDAWLFPFMNVFATVGALNGKGTIPLSIQGDDLLDFLGLGGLCDSIIQSEFCSRTLSTTAYPEYDGENYTVGINLATGWQRYFFTLPITYTWSNVNIIDNTTETFTASPRIGVIGDIGKAGKLATYVGAMYLDVEVDLTGTATFDTNNSGAPGVGDQVTVDFSINQRNKDKWNYLLGFNWDFNANWAVQAEVGFGGSRESFITSATFRY